MAKNFKKLFSGVFATTKEMHKLAKTFDFLVRLGFTDKDFKKIASAKTEQDKIQAILKSNAFKDRILDILLTNYTEDGKLKE